MQICRRWRATGQHKRGQRRQPRIQAVDVVLKALDLAPLLDLKMRLGEGSGAALAVGIARAAVACHNSMATFAEAGVAGKE